jgi:hypothetical protein
LLEKIPENIPSGEGEPGSTPPRCPEKQKKMIGIFQHESPKNRHILIMFIFSLT